jgi:hypothetical protein
VPAGEVVVVGCWEVVVGGVEDVEELQAGMSKAKTISKMTRPNHLFIAFLLCYF